MKGHVTYRTHTVMVESVDTRVYCFKHNDQLCDMQIFDDYDDMVEWALVPFPTITYNLVIDNKR